MANEPIEDANYLREVREQYENYPYPPRTPEDELKRLQVMYHCALDCVNYYNYGGKRDFSKGFRALVAGGGTGDSAIMLAEQLRGIEGGEVVFLDISHASMEVAQARAKIRGLTNIEWVHGSLLDAKTLFDRKFDHIDCIGVLHHLEKPAAGLAALASVLKDDGAMALMLYGRYGREAVYQLQALMRIVNRGEENLQRKIDNCKAVLRNLPKNSRFAELQTMLSDVDEFGDVGIYDLLLHSHDIAFTVPDVHALLAKLKLEATHFFFDQHGMGNDVYRLNSYIEDGSLEDVLGGLSAQDKQAAAELMNGRIAKHVFYAARASTPPPAVDDLDNVPFLSLVLSASDYPGLAQVVKTFQVGAQITVSLKRFGMEIRLIKSAHADEIFKAMDGVKTLGQILRDVQAAMAGQPHLPSLADLKREFSDIFAAFNKQDLMFLRDKSVPAFLSARQLQDRMMRARG